ncbi:MAG: hypothetical protein U0822_25745 [Anaerolineae bacterium]
MRGSERLERGLSLLDDGHWDEAVAALEDAHAESPGSVSAYWLVQARFQRARHTSFTSPWEGLAEWREVARQLAAARTLAGTRVEVDTTLLGRESVIARASIVETLLTIGALAARAGDLVHLERLADSLPAPEPAPYGLLRGYVVALAPGLAPDSLLHKVRSKWWGVLLDPGARRADHIFGHGNDAPTRTADMPQRESVRAEVARIYPVRVVWGSSVRSGRRVLCFDHSEVLDTERWLDLEEIVEISDGAYLGRGLRREGDGEAALWHDVGYYVLATL